MRNKIFMSLFMLFSIVCSSQTRYYKQFNGKILNNSEFKKLKKESLNNLKKTSNEVCLMDETKELRRNKDSIIYDIVLYSIPKSMLKELKARKKLIGKKFSSENLITIDGNKIDFSDLNGKPSLINFWYTQCSPCVEEIPALNQIKEEFKDKINFISITLDTKEKVLKFLEKINFDFIHVTDSKTIIKKLGIDSYPQNYLINKEGYIYSIENGIGNIVSDDGKRKIGDGKWLKEKLKKLLIE